MGRGECVPRKLICIILINVGSLGFTVMERRRNASHTHTHTQAHAGTENRSCVCVACTHRAHGLMDGHSCLFVLCWLQEGGDPQHSTSVWRGRTNTHKTGLHIMNKEWAPTHGRRNQTHVHTLLFFLQMKLVLINLAGGTRHVFPFTSCLAPRVERLSGSHQF